MTHERIRIALIDAHRVVVEPLALRLSSEPDLEIVATATDGTQGLTATLETRPAIVIQGLNFSEPFEFAVNLSQAIPETFLLILSAIHSDIYLEQALRIPVTRGYILKEDSIDFLIAGIRSIAGGCFCFSERVQERLTYIPSENRYAVSQEGCLHELTDRQLEVLRHLASGQSVKEVARLLHLSEKSVDSHKYRIMNKLGIHDRVGLARYAIREGLLLP